MNAVETTSDTVPVRVLPARAMLCLTLQTLLYSALSLWALELLPISGAAWMGSISLSLAYAVAGIVGACVFTPWLSEDFNERHPSLRALFTALYQAIVLVFFLRLAGRLSPQAASASWEAGAWMFQIALLLYAVSRLFPRAFSGIAFAWIVTVPVFAYMLAELTLIGAGGVSWQDQARNDATQNIVLLVRALEQLSPLTALMGALNKNLPDGSPASFVWPMLGFGIVNAVFLFFSAKRGQIEKRAA